MKISLHGFCKANNLPKSSVYRKCQDIGIDTSEGLTKEDCDRLLVEFGRTPVTVGEAKDVAASVEAIAPVIHQVEIVPSNDDLVARKIQPQVTGYDTTDLDIATQLNVETLDFNLNAMGSQLVEQMRQLAKLHAAQARQVYAHTIAQEMQMGLGKQPGTTAE